MNRRRSSLVSGAGYWLLAWSVPISVGIGWGVGWLLDERLGTAPWLQVIGFLLGAAAGLKQILSLSDKNNGD
jgi:F0F1-type ATP synthase assembly protein I